MTKHKEPKTPSHLAPGSYSCHEALHIVSVAEELATKHILEHEAIQADTEWLELAEQACSALGRLYLAIGRKHIGADEMTDKSVKIQRLPNLDLLPLPSYATTGSVGMDLCAAVDQAVWLPPGETTLIPTGIRVAVPSGYELQIRPRSGLALNKSIDVANSPGTIDQDYRGELMVILVNRGSNLFRINPGDRIAQAVLSPVARVIWDEVNDLDETDRGAGGFGSTGA